MFCHFAFLGNILSVFLKREWSVLSEIQNWPMESRTDLKGERGRGLKVQTVADDASRGFH